MLKLLRRALFALGVLLLLAVAAAAVYVWQATPKTDGTLRLAGPRAEVQIERDAHGIPTVRGASVEDAMFGLGFVHAQDRLWQLETHRRIGAGRLAEAFGEGALANDRFLRALGVRHAAAAQWQRTSGETRAVLQAYAGGINAAVRAGGALPPEFLVLGVRPEDWQPEDSLAWAIMMAWDLGGNWSGELLRLRLALRLPVQRIHEVLPPYPGERPLVTTDYAALYRGLGLDGQPTRTAALEALDALERAAPPSGVEGAGSNNWVVAGSHTTTGRPLLANDPHLKLTTPALWYFARLEAPGLKVAGATMPGLPLVVLGQNEHVAWGFTNTNPDVQDLYLERLNPDDASQVQTPDGWAPLETRDEIIRVKGRPDVPVTVRRSRHGPLISDAGVSDGLTGQKDKPAYAIAMRWTALEADADPVGTGLAMNRARSVAGFVDATRGWVAPMQNMAVADRDGRIGFVAAGRVPVRRADHDLKGYVPAPGWDARYDWAGWIAAEATPREFDPARGWIATANQNIHGADYPHFLTSEWTAPYRQQRIEHLLRSRRQHSLDNLRAMQADTRSLATLRLLPWLAKARSDHPLAESAKRQLDGFDGTMAADRAAPLIFWAWVRQLTAAVFADELGPLYERNLGSRSFRDALEGVLDRDDAWWCDDKTTPAAERCAALADVALARALDELSARFGADPKAWRWGDAHQARSEHRPFSRVAALARWFEVRTPVGGDTYTVNASRVALKGEPGALYANEHGPSLRALYDLGEPANSRVMHSSGQSGLPWQGHYRDFVRPWAAVEDVPLWRSPALQTLRLMPQ